MSRLDTALAHDLLEASSDESREGQPEVHL